MCKNKKLHKHSHLQSYLRGSLRECELKHFVIMLISISIFPIILRKVCKLYHVIFKHFSQLNLYELVCTDPDNHIPVDNIKALVGDIRPKAVSQIVIGILGERHRLPALQLGDAGPDLLIWCS